MALVPPLGLMLSVLMSLILLQLITPYSTPLKSLSMFCVCYTFMVACRHTGLGLVRTTCDALSLPEQEVGLTSQPKSYYRHYGKWLLR